jgi:hypothetical protein
VCDKFTIYMREEKHKDEEMDGKGGGKGIEK